MLQEKNVMEHICASKSSDWNAIVPTDSYPQEISS
jgi:hypothetical protein